MGQRPRRTDGTRQRPPRGEDLVHAAGGILLRPGASGGPEVALVHRPKYDDWSFPKGKLKPDEGHREAALREVEEETGLRCRLERDAGIARYRDRLGRPKEVRYWIMRPEGGRFVPTREVDQLRWLPVTEAAEVLTYQHDRDLLEALGS